MRQPKPPSNWRGPWGPQDEIWFMRDDNNEWCLHYEQQRSGAYSETVWIRDGEFGIPKWLQGALDAQERSVRHGIRGEISRILP